MDYVLMHKNIPVMDCRFEDTYLTSVGRVHDSDHLPPFRRINDEKPTILEFVEWWQRRAIPKHRYNLYDISQQLPANANTSNGLQMVNLGLTLSDQYWVRPRGSQVTWEDVNFFDNDFGHALSDVMLGGTVTITDTGDLINPSSGLGGDQVKAWKIVKGNRVLLKKGTEIYHNQEPLNELIGSRVCDLLGAEHVSYGIVKHTGDIYSACNVAVSGDEDMCGAFDIVPNATRSKSLESYRKFLKDHNLSDIGIDQMLILDYILDNHDRHWSNFGVIRDAETLQYTRTIPIFDFGNSLWLNRDVEHIGADDSPSKMISSTMRHNLSSVDKVPFRSDKIAQIPTIVADCLRKSGFNAERAKAINEAVESRVEQVLRYFDSDFVKAKEMGIEGEENEHRIEIK